MSGNQAVWLLYLVGSQSGAQHRADSDGINVVRQKGQVARVQGNVLLKAAVFMVQMVRASGAVLLGAGEAKLAPPADAAGEADAHETAHLDVRVDAGTQRNNASDALVSADMGQLDVEDWLAVWAGRDARLRVEVYACVGTCKSLS